MELLPFFPDLPAYRYTVALDGAQYEVRLVWRERTAAWYLDLADAAGTWLVRGRRLSPGSSPQQGVITTGPTGAIVPIAADPYARSEMQIGYLSADELAAAVPDLADLLPVVLAR